MADLTLPIHPAPEPNTAADAEHFVLSLSTEEKSRDGLLRALCLRAAFLALLAYCVYSAASVIKTSWGLIGNQWENTYPEAPHVYAAIRSATTHRLYFPFTQQPYVLQSYGPLFYEMYYWMARSVHADIARFIQLARVTDFLCFLLCGVLIAAVCRRLGFSALTCVAATTLALGVPIFCSWAVTTRPDMYFLAAMMASLLVAIWEESPGKWACAAAGALGGVAFLIKQPGIAVLIAVAVVWVIHKKFRQAAIFAVGALVPVVLMFGLLLWRKEQFVAQFVSVGQAMWSLSSGLAYTRSILEKATLLVPIVIGAIGFGRAISSGPRGQLVASFTLVNWMIGLSGMPQIGSAANYLFGGLLGCGLLLPFAFEFVRERVKFAPALLIIAIVLCYLTNAYAISGVLPTVNFSPGAYQSLQPYRILSDHPEFSLYGREPDLLDPFSIHALELGSGLWSSAPIEQRIRDLDYDLVILTCSRGSRVVCGYRGVNFFSAGVIEALNANYAVFCANKEGIVLTPRGRRVEVTAEMLAAPLAGACSTADQGQAPGLIAMRGMR